MIKYKKHKGSFSKPLIVGAFIMVIFVCMFNSKLTTIEGQDVQDSLHFANISTYKEIDKRILGDSKEEIIIKDPQKAFNDFKENIKANMELDNNFMPRNSSIITGKITIKHFIIYNVQGNLVNIYSIGPYDAITHETKDLTKGIIRTPNGYKIEATTVHSTLCFKSKGVFGREEEREITVDTDIVNKKDINNP